MSSGGQIRLISFLVIGLIVGFGIGFLTPSLVAPTDDYDMIMARGYMIVGHRSKYSIQPQVNLRVLILILQNM